MWGPCVLLSCGLPPPPLPPPPPPPRQFVVCERSCSCSRNKVLTSERSSNPWTRRRFYKLVKVSNRTVAHGRYSNVLHPSLLPILPPALPPPPPPPLPPSPPPPPPTNTPGVPPYCPPRTGKTPPATPWPLTPSVRRLREELQLLQEQGFHVGEVIKPMTRRRF